MNGLEDVVVLSFSDYLVKVKMMHELGRDEIHQVQ